jgi:glycosyltransferase involved in cell wall biosynthesis
MEAGVILKDRDFTPSVAILLCTYNGARFVKGQLDSYERQDHQNWQLWVSDDGSADETLSILEEYKNKWPKNKLKLFVGPQKGFAANYLSLVLRKEIIADYYAFSDQDDIWQDTKLSRAIKLLKNAEQKSPALYCSRTNLIDISDNIIGTSQYFRQPPSFANSLVQSIAGGNTMVFDPEARRTLAHLASKTLDIVSHDWLLYQIVTGRSGLVIYDIWPSVNYRQHGSNLVGSNYGLSAKYRRAKRFLGGTFKEWSTKNEKALCLVENEFSEKAASEFKSFRKLRRAGLPAKLHNLLATKFPRQTKLGTFALSLGIVLGLV